jgi:hypothetical protein
MPILTFVRAAQRITTIGRSLLIAIREDSIETLALLSRTVRLENQKTMATLAEPI